MTDTAPAGPQTAEPALLLETWMQCVGQVLSQVSGASVSCALLPELPQEVAAAGDADLWLGAAFSQGLRGEMSLRLPAPTVLRFAQAFRGEGAPTAEELGAEHREATVELMRQVAGLVSTSLAARWGEVQLRLEALPGPPTWPAAAMAGLRAGDDAGGAFLELQLSAALMAALRSEKPDRPPENAAVQDAMGDPSANLGLLMDVELAVSLRFGCRRLFLRDVLDLNPGAVVELDRQVNEPVELLLDGRLLARGEVVVMDGNYALRVTEVAPQG